MYSFLATASNKSTKFGSLKLCVNDKVMAVSSRSASRPTNGDQEDNDSRSVVKSGEIWVQATLQLKKNEKVMIYLNGTFYRLDLQARTYFEGRLITKLDEE